MCEVEGILNLRPLSPVQAFSCEIGPITPFSLLTPGTIDIPPLESNEPNCIYARKRYKHVQYLTELFWIRWKKEYLLSLLNRPKWHESHDSLKVGDLVLLTDSNLPRNRWPMGTVERTIPSRDGVVRKVEVRVVRLNNEANQNVCSLVIRPVVKLIPVLRVE